MHTTSHFIGIPIMLENFANIFLEVNSLLGAEREKILEFQNPLSLHITLYYLPEKLAKIEQEKICKILSYINISMNDLQLGKLEYFGQKIAYVGWKNPESLSQIHTLFREKLPEYNTLTDNAYPSFIPHMTLWKIKNTLLYQQYQENIEKIIQENLNNISFHNIFSNISLYAVNSTFSPELQIIIS